MERRTFLGKASAGLGACAGFRSLTRLDRVLARSLPNSSSSSLNARGISDGSGEVYVLLWFDTEDFTLPQSDGSAKRIAEFLQQQGIRGTFKVVGEKARTLERRGRSDVIKALAGHEIGYHSNFHSRHPTVAEYESSLDWEQGAKEFTRREYAGFQDVSRIFGKKPTCYGQPGSSWAPQAFPALKDWGVRVYLDTADFVSLNGKPFWYGGLLNIFKIAGEDDLRPNGDWSNLNQARLNFKALHDRLLTESQGGLVSLYFHPCEFVHREFADVVNFGGGASTPLDRLKLPPVRSQAEVETAFGYLEGLVTYMKSLPSVRFITASEALDVYPDTNRGRQFSAEELSEIIRAVRPEVSFQAHRDYDLTASEVFELLNQFVESGLQNKLFTSCRLSGSLFGPTYPSTLLPQSLEIPWWQFSATVSDVSGFLENYHQIPNVVWFGSVGVPPESYVVALAKTALTLLDKREPPKSVLVEAARLAAAEYVSNDSPQLWSWPIFPPGFHSSHIVSLAKLQAWTLKPARIRSS